MGIISVTTFTSDTETVTRTKLNGLAANLVTEFNGSIDNDNIKANAGIVGTKLNLTDLATSIGTSTSANAILATVTASSISVQFTDCSTVNGTGVPATSGRLYRDNIIFGWITFDTNSGGVPNVLGSFNVSSLDDNGTGNITVNWHTDFPNTAYAAVATCKRSGTWINIGTKATSSVVVTTYTGSTPAAVDDTGDISVIAVGYTA